MAVRASRHPVRTRRTTEALSESERSEEPVIVGRFKDPPAAPVSGRQRGLTPSSVQLVALCRFVRTARHLHFAVRPSPDHTVRSRHNGLVTMRRNRIGKIVGDDNVCHDNFCHNRGS